MDETGDTIVEALDDELTEAEVVDLLAEALEAVDEVEDEALGRILMQLDRDLLIDFVALADDYLHATDPQ